MPTLPTGNSTIYMTYGNVSLSSESEGDNVFEFFDDFNSFSATKWTNGVVATASSDWSYYGGALIGTNNNRYLQSQGTFTGAKIQETWQQTIASCTNGFTPIGFWASTTNGVSILHHASGPNQVYTRNNGTWISHGTNHASYLLNQWVRSIIRHDNTNLNTQRFNSAGTNVLNYSANNGVLSGERVRLGARHDNGNYNQSYTSQWDWLFVRPYISVEPTVTFGAVQTSDNQFCGLPTGSFNFNVLDVGGCNNAVSTTITQPSAALNVSLSMTEVGCYVSNDGTINLTVTGGTQVSTPPPYYYNWAGPSGYSSTTEDPSGVGPGIYNVTVADDNACSASGSITVTQLVPLNSGFYTWKGTTNQLWEIDTNWDCRVPDQTSHVLIPAAPVGGNTPLITGGVIGECLKLRVMGSVADLLKIDSNAGSKLRVHEP